MKYLLLKFSVTYLHCAVALFNEISTSFQIKKKKVKKKYHFLFNKPKNPIDLVYHIAIVLYECYIS